jgi:hypothetical protein
MREFEGFRGQKKQTDPLDPEADAASTFRTHRACRPY